MKPLPFRLRVAWWSAIATGTALFVFAAGTLANLYLEQIEQVDLELQGAARRMTDADAMDREGSVSHEAREMEYEPWMAAAVFAEDGRLLLDSSRLPEAIARAAQVHKTPATLNSGGQDWRVIAIGGSDQTIIVAYNLEEVGEIVADLLAAYLIALPLAAGIAALGGWIVAGRALGPVRAATAAAERITPARLDQRLPVPAVRDEIADLARVINSLLERLEKSFRQAERFAADASHEIRTPLTIIKGEVEAALRTTGLQKPVETRLLSVQEEITRLQRIAEQLLLLARFDSGAAQIRHERLDLAALVREACDDVELIATSQELTLSVQAAPGAVVIGDVEQLRGVVLNLLDNACKFNERGGHIACAVRSEAAYVILDVENTGRGIPGDVHEAVFRRFFRADQARGRGGVGLGLSLCREIVQAHDGDLELVRSAPGSTLFRVRLPAASAESRASLRGDAEVRTLD